MSKPRVSDTWAWHTGALLALCETKGLRQDFPVLQVGKQGLIKVSTPDHSGCKFVHLGPPGILWASSALRLFSNAGPKGLTRKHALSRGGSPCWHGLVTSLARNPARLERGNFNFCGPSWLETLVTHMLRTTLEPWALCGEFTL